MRNLYRPESFHYHHRLSASSGTRFEGWYFKVVDAAGEQPYAFIPGIFLGDGAHAFVQVLDGARGRAWYHRYPTSAFSAAASGLDIRIGGNHFRDDGFDLDLDGATATGQQRVRGSVSFGPRATWPVSWRSIGCMGPFGLLPFLECYHGILSMDHALSGSLEVDGQTTRFDAGRGYLEKDWGRGFPEAYVWMHSNHFDPPGVSVTASVAKIPLLGSSFRGFLAGLLLDGELLRFATYTGARVTRCAITTTHVHIEIRDARHLLVLDAEKTEGALLNAPYDKQMLGRVAETMQSRVHVRLSTRTGAVRFEGSGVHGCLEAVGHLPAITF